MAHSSICTSFMAGVLLLALGCSESSGLHASQGTGGAGGSSSGMGASTGGSEGGTTVWSGVCNEVPCLGALFVPCQPSGSCTSSGTALPITNCYSNGVKQQVRDSGSYNGKDVSVLLSQTRDSKVCFTIKAVLTTGGDAYYVFIDGKGQQVATGTSLITNTEVVMVTCNGASPVEMSQECAETVNFGSEKCSPGQCSF